MAGADEVEELLFRAGAMPYGSAKSALVEEALRRAEAAGDRALAFQVRMSLTEAYQFGGESAKSFATFSRCLSDYDADPARHDAGVLESLLWQYKWIVGDLSRFPEIPLPRALALLDDMERRYREAGYGLHAVYAERCGFAKHLGDREAAAEWFHRWHIAPPDELSDCAACDPSAKVAYLAWAGRDEEAIEVAAPVLADEVTCYSQPHGILSNLLGPYLRTGRPGEAVEAHRRAYRTIRARGDELSRFGDHIEFCALTGNEARGLEILERDAPPIQRADSPSDAMWFAAKSGLLLRRLDEAGHGGTVVRRFGAETTVAELRAEMEATARAIAARFDARNGDDGHTRAVEATLSARPLVDYLPLMPHARRFAVPAAVAAPAPSTGDPEGLLEEAERHWEHGDTAAALAAWERYDRLGGPSGPGHEGRRADGHGLAAIMRGRPEEAVREWERAARAHERAGDEARRQSSLGRAGLLKCMLGATEEGLAMVEASAAHLLAHGTPAQRASARWRLAKAYAVTGRAPEAVALLRAATSGPDADGQLLVLLAELIEPDDPREAREVAARARRALADGGGVHLAYACMLHARLLRTTTENPSEETLEALREAYGQALAAAPPSEVRLRAMAHGNRGSLLLVAGAYPEAAEDLIEAVAAFTALGETAESALARVDLCRAYLRTGRPAEAVETAEEALALLAEDDIDNRLNVRWTRAEALRDLGGPEEALSAFTDLAADAERAGLPSEALAEITEEIGRSLAFMGRYEEAADRFAAAADGYGEGIDRVRALRLRGQALHLLDEDESSLAVYAEIRAMLDALPQDDVVAWERSMTALQEGRSLQWLDRPEEAMARFTEAETGFAALGDSDKTAEAKEAREHLLGPQ